MEPWRKRGFVPDSDEEEEFESLEDKSTISQDGTALDEVDLEYIPLPVSTSAPQTTGNEHSNGENTNGPITLSDVGGGHGASERNAEVRDQAASINADNGNSLGSSTPVDRAEDRPASPSLGEQTPKPRRARRTYGKRSSSTKTPISLVNDHNNSQEQDDGIWDIPSSPVLPVRLRSKSRSHVFTPFAAARAQSPQYPTAEPPGTQELDDSRSSRSSSPDEINVVTQTPARTAPKTEQIQGQEAPQHESSNDESPLSSPPSSLSSPREDSHGDEEGTVAAPETNPEDRDLHAFERLLRQESLPEQQQHDPEGSRPPQEDQPPLGHQRVFRPRKLKQQFPYKHDMEQYLLQCKQSGTKATFAGWDAHMRRKKTTHAADDSQEQEFDPSENRSSPPREEWLSSIRSERHRERNPAAQASRRNAQRGSPVQRTHSHKRRKQSHSGIWSGKKSRVQGSRSRPQVVINNTPPRSGIGQKIYDIPSSPPHSRSVSSASETPRVSEGFHSPPGLTPPATTTTGFDSNSATPRPNQHIEVISLDSAAASDGEALSDASQDSAEPGQDDEELQNRLMQRRIRGVLPASWVRIDAQQRLKQQKESQRSRHAAAVQRADGKGVARKVVRRRDQSSGPLEGLLDLGDPDESDEEIQPPHPVEPELDDEERLARAVGFENPFNQDGDEDIVEDNRVDYMLPTIERNAGPREKRRSLKRVHSKESSEQKERRLKKARLKRQTRLTDASYGSRRTKQTTTISAPRLGILDAPDVASRPRREQPQFLRIAARRARSRRDGGRQSPTRKFLQLGSKDDTADANESLRDWRRGAIRQTRIGRPQPKPRKRQTLTNGSFSGHQPASTSRNSRIPHHFPVAEQIVVPGDDQPAPPTGGPISSAAPTLLSNETSHAESLRQAERRGNQWIVRRNVAISSLQRNNPRPAATSMAAPSESQAANRAMFGRSLSLLNRDYRQKHSARPFKPSLTLDRFISDDGSAGSPSSSLPSTTPNHSGSNARFPPREGRARLKKRTPRRINLESDEYVQEEEPLAAVLGGNDPPTSHSGTTGPSCFSVGGLFNWQRTYSIDFGISPLRDGTFFHESTFIGSGDFSRSLHVLRRDLDKENGFASIPVKGRLLQWGPWNEIVSSGMGSAFDMIIDDVENSASSPPDAVSSSDLTQASLTYLSLIKYVTDILSFIDPIDRTEFISRTMGLVFKLRDPMAAFVTSTGYNTRGLVRFACYNLVFANQIRQISSHDLVSPSLRNDTLDLARVSAKDTLELAFTEAGIDELQRFLDENKNPERREKGFREEYPTAEASIVAQKLLRSSDAYAGLLDELLLGVYTKLIARKHKDVSALEKGWRGLFARLPLIEFDGHGIARRESRFKVSCDNWITVKRLLAPVLEQCDINSAAQPMSYNVYCRTLFQRCHRLINLWGWRECRPILETLYDFFAQKTLYNLRLEESRGSPSFLDELDQNPPLDVRNGEPCFHTLLKIIASGLRFLSQRYDKKKIRNFAWRLLPNHGRVYPKEQPLRHEDLDALRNHHDLLCTLYWAVPDGCRPRLEAIRNLVQPASSHRETCSINIRSWTRLVRFKLSTNEDVSGLDPFADWHTYFLSELRQQHSHARKEIEAQSKGDQWVSRELIESTISQNQKQIESLLSMALSGLQTAVQLAPSLDHAHRLISKTPFDSILGMFNPQVARVNVVVSEALQVIVAYTKKDAIAPPPESGAAVPTATTSSEDDSQEYGDWADIDAALVQQNTLNEEGIEHVQRSLNPVVSRLVSNCFGADHCPEDAILVSVVDCWTSIAQVLVRHGLNHWENYLSQFGDESWARLRDTTQTRRFASQFLAVCIEKDARVLIDCRILVMGMWFASLAERSSMLKFQHRLTEALLNGSRHDPLLQNLPFTKDRKSNRYVIKLEELSQRRLSLLSSLLSNMREHVLRLEMSADSSLNVTKQEYSELLQQLMNAMKDNYRELGNGAVESAQGAYVDFVHRVIRFLQELTSDIRPVDPFFTDPAYFPLPSDDPRYIVAKLKRYEPKLHSKKELVTLIGFIQGIAERALVEGQQSHLVDQLHTAMRDTYEAGRADKSTLRAVLLQSVFPAYLELAFSSPAAWLLSRPIIQSISLVFKDLLFNIDTTASACVSSLLAIFDAVFQSTYRALRPLSNGPSRFKDPVVQSMLANFLEMIISSLVVVDYIDRLGDDAEALVSYIQWFRDFANAVINLGSDERLLAMPSQEPMNSSNISTPEHLSAARRLAFEDHQACLRNWSLYEGKYYYTRPGHDSKEIPVEPVVASIVENEAIAKKELHDASSRLTDQIEQLGLLPPHEGTRNEPFGKETSDESGLSDIYSFLRLH